MKNITYFLLITLFLTVAVLSTIFLSPIGLAAYNTTTIAVNVSTLAQISVSPTILEWIGIAPGASGTDKTLTIINTGSVPFSTGIEASVNTFSAEATNPLGGISTAYGAGTYLVMKNTTSGYEYFVNRMEWNDTSIVDSLVGPETTKPIRVWGKFRNKTQFWVWEIANDNTVDKCQNITNTTFKIQNTEGSSTLNSGTSSGTGSANTTEWSTWTFTAGPLIDYCVAIRKNCDSLMIYRWDKNTSLPSCSKARYLNSSLNVGESLVVTANVNIPSGTPSGNATNSILTITAT
jgi:hypothetical protein